MKIILYLFTFMIAVFALSCSRSNNQSDSFQVTPIPVGQPQSLAADSKNTAEIVTNGPVINENGWYTDWNAGLAAALEQKRPVIVDFYTDWCQWCKVMDDSTFSDPSIQKKFADGWIMIKVNAENDKSKGVLRGATLTYSEIARRFGISGYPSYGFLDKKGEPVNVLVGYREVPQFTVILDFFQQEIYKLNDNEQQKFIDSYEKSGT